MNRSDSIDHLKLDPQDGFDLTAYSFFDYGTRPDDFDCYTPEQVKAWENDEWFYAGVEVVASRNGIELYSNSLWGNEFGSIPFEDFDTNETKTLWIDLQTFDKPTLDSIAHEAILGAKQALAELIASESANA